MWAWLAHEKYNYKNSLNYRCLKKVKSVTVTDTRWSSGLLGLFQSQDQPVTFPNRYGLMVQSLCTLWQGSWNLSATSSMTTVDAETEFEPIIILIIIVTLWQNRMVVLQCTISCCKFSVNSVWYWFYWCKYSSIENQLSSIPGFLNLFQRNTDVWLIIQAFAN